MDQNAQKAAPAAAPDPSKIAQDAPGSIPEGGVATPVAKDPNEERIALLTRKEKALRFQARQLEQQKKALEAEKANIKPDMSWKDKIKTDFPGLLAEAGLSVDEVASQLMNTTQDSVQVRALKAEMQELKAELEKMTSGMKDSQSQAYQQALKQVSRDVKNLVSLDESFEMIKTTQNEDAVVSLIEQTYNEDGILLSAKEAAQQIEDYLVEEALTFAKAKKIQGKLAPQEVPATEKTEPIQSKTVPTTTLTHSATSGVPKSLSDKERRQRAILAFQNKLK